MLILTGQTLVQQPLSVEAKGRFEYFRIPKVDRPRIGRAIAETAAAPVHGQVFMQAPQRMHFRAGQKSAMPRRAERQEPDEDAEVLGPRDQLLDVARGDVELRQVGREVGVVLVSADDEGAD